MQGNAPFEALHPFARTQAFSNFVCFPDKVLCGSKKLQVIKLRVKRKNNVIFWEISFIYKKWKISPENAFYQKYSIFSWCCHWILWYMLSFKYILTIVKINIDFHKKIYSYNRREVSFKNEAMVKLKCILYKKCCL